MRTRILLAIAVAACATAGAAQAERGDPQRRIVAADQRAAQAMLLRKVDLAAAFAVDGDPGPGVTDGYCKALDESDLVLTGEGESPTFTLERTGTYIGIGSAAQLYRSQRMADASWRRGTSAAGVACLHTIAGRELGKDGFRVESSASLRFERLAEKTFARRLVFSRLVNGVPARVYLDYVALARGRAHALVFFASAFAPVPKADEVALMRLVAGRMARTAASVPTS